MACGILIPQSQVEPEPLGWESWVQDTRLLETSWSQGVLISGNSHKDLHLYPRLGTTHLLASPRAGCLTQTTSKTGIQTQSLADRLPTNTSKHHLTQCCPSNVKKKKKKTQQLQPEWMHKSYTSQILDKPLDQPYPWGQRPKARGTTTLQPGERRLQTQQAR